ncbi:hypothetical protein LINGRAHAP2_LOCUS36944, partial [Linum grandiflorum]
TAVRVLCVSQTKPPTYSCSLAADATLPTSPSADLHSQRETRRRRPSFFIALALLVAIPRQIHASSETEMMQ